VTTDDSRLSISISQNGVKDWLDYIYIQKLDAVPVTVTDAGYATFSSKYALDFTNSAIKAYTASVEGNRVNMTRQTGTVPAATGLFLQGTVGTAVSVDMPLATSVPADISNNALQPHLEDGIVAAGNYVFSGTATGGQLAFRRLSTDTNVPGGRSYLSIPSTETRLYVTIDDEESGIKTIDYQPEECIYDLQGRKITGMTNKGVYIVNGKKYIKP
jgi:hypothetical protein